MNKQEVIEKIKDLNARETFMSGIIWVKRDEVLDIVNQLDAPEETVAKRYKVFQKKSGLRIGMYQNDGSFKEDFVKSELKEYSFDNLDEYEIEEV